MKALIVPPGGFAGAAQMTRASVAALSQGLPAQRRNKRKKTRTARATKASSTRARRKTNGKKKPNRLVKGSAAAKAYMAKIRRKRK